MTGLKVLILVGFNDMGHDKWFWMGKFGLLLDFIENFDDIDKVKFWRKSVNESAIRFAAFPVYLISFNYPPVKQKQWIIDIYYTFFSDRTNVR